MNGKHKRITVITERYEHEYENAEAYLFDGVLTVYGEWKGAKKSGTYNFNNILGVECFD